MLSFDPQNPSSLKEVLPQDIELRTKVNEYGGCSFEVDDEGIYFIEKKGNQVWFCDHNQKMKQITHSPDRFAELLKTPFGLVAVQEKAYADEASHTAQKLCLISLVDGSIKTLHSGADFYSNPTFQGNFLSFLSWSHPHMPWNENTLWQGILSEDGLKDCKAISKETNVSHFAPVFLKSGDLLFSSDESGFWNLCIYQNGKKSPLTSLQIEIGYPQWIFGLSCFSEMNGKIHWIGSHDATWKKGTYDLATKKLELETTPMTFFAQQRSDDSTEVWIEASPDIPLQIVYRKKGEETKVLRKSFEKDLPTYSPPESLKTTISNREVQGFYYAPSNNPSPLLIRCHGGPTAMSTATYDPKIAYWLSKGFAVFDINYTGSSGFGRKFRDLLNGHWGEYDWRDAEGFAKELVLQNKAKKDLIFISGSSAGGFTALCAAARSPLFAGATSYYGISDLITLHKTTHRFESHYDQSLIGRFSESKNLYEKRSPMHFLNDWKTPTLFLQGEDDKVVPPDQSQTLYDALQKQGIKTEIKIYPEEGHGFRRYENQLDSLEREYRFYNEILLSKQPRSQ